MKETEENITTEEFLMFEYILSTSSILECCFVIVLVYD